MTYTESTPPTADPEVKLAARIDALPGQEDALAALLLALVPDTRAEEGCVRYDLFRDQDNPAMWIFVEVWATHAIWRKHVDGARFQQFKKDIEGIAKDGPYKLDDFAVAP